MPDGALAGRIKLEGSDKWVFFKGDTLVDRIQGREFDGVNLNVYHDILPDGTLQLYVKIQNEGFKRPLF